MKSSWAHYLIYIHILICVPKRAALEVKMFARRHHMVTEVHVEKELDCVAFSFFGLEKRTFSPQNTKR